MTRTFLTELAEFFASEPTARVNIQPAELGSVRIDITVRDGGETYSSIFSLSREAAVECVADLAASGRIYLLRQRLREAREAVSEISEQVKSCE